MKNWYFAKCDKCKEVQYFFVNNVHTTAHYLGNDPEAKDINDFFQRHYACELTMGWRDDHLDALWKEGYTNKTGDGKIKFIPENEASFVAIDLEEKEECTCKTLADAWICGKCH